MEFERWQWTAKHHVPMQTYQVECPICELTYFIEASELGEMYCPFCENTEPIKASVARNTKEVDSGR